MCIAKWKADVTNTASIAISQTIFFYLILRWILKAGRYEDLLQKADEENLKNGSEVDKWRKRTTELLQNEEKLKAELDKVKLGNKMKQPQNQCTQTEVRYINILHK